jgi:amino acid adenylation domain-containing protein
LAHDRHIPPFERFLQFAAPTFDVSIFEIFFPLFRGQTIVGCSREQLLDDLPTVIRELDADAAELTPTVASNLLQGRKSVPTLKLLLTIGEMLTKNLIDEFGGSSSKESILWGMYGPTEAAIHCTLQPSFQIDSPVGNIGFPLDSVSAFVAAPSSQAVNSRCLELLPLGEIGELVIGGPQVADEYLNRPELTAAAFIQHGEFGLLYRTGDKARFLSNGYIECLGRIVSGQVKLRGQRVELGEIEQALSRTDGCHIAAALIIKDTLVAFCATDAQHVTKAAVIETCKRWLPNHMVPSDIVLLPRLPQLPSGKVDKKALERRYHVETHDDNPTCSSNSPVHSVVQRVLGRNAPPTAPLGSLGLDSLRAIQIASILRTEGYDVGAVEVLSAANLKELVTISERKQGQDRFESPDILSSLRESQQFISNLGLEQYQDEITDIIPCSPLQEAMLAETVARPDAYCNWIEVKLHQPRSYSEIRSHIQHLAKKNEILRSGFSYASSSNDGSFVQVIWRHLADSQITQVTSFSRKFTIGSTEAMLRPLTIQVNVNNENPRILFQMHHALYDGWSFDLIVRDLYCLLRGYPQPASLRPQYREVVKFHSRKDGHSASASYWADILDGYRPVHLPNFNGQILPPTSLRSMSGTSKINGPILINRARELEINPQVFFQAALTYMISSYVGSTDVVVGTVTSGRTIPITGIENILGPCIASLPLRVDMSNFSTIKSLLEGIQAANRGMLQHCTLSLREIAKTCGVHPGTHLFDVQFIWQQSLINTDTSSTISIIDQADSLEYKLTLEFEPRGDRILHKATYDPSILPEAQVTHTLQQIDDLVHHFVNNSHLNVDTIGQCFRPHVLSIANPTPDLPRYDHSPAYAVERWATKTPEQEAVVIGTLKNGTMTTSDRLTYAGLNMRANQLAHHLLAEGIGEDELICIIMEKSANLYVAILAVLKLGCGYLPIVPESPRERTRKILTDARVKICISESSISEDVRSQGLCKVLDLDSMQISQYSVENLNVKYNGSHLAYAVFTSGSTGTPKGVLVTQDNLMSNLGFLYGLYPTTRESKLLQACSQAFDVSVFEIFFTWYAGMCLCTATKDDLFSDIERSVNELGITHLSLTPTVASLVHPDRVPKVKFLVTAGEAVTEHVRRQWAGRGLYQGKVSCLYLHFDSSSHFPLGYGPSETTNICTIRPEVTNSDLINNIGPPFSNTSAFVMNPDGSNILPRGAIGELCFGGAQVFRGYLNMPDLNAKKIINHPQYGRVYRSGDMGMLLPDNSILFTGRSDDQVKIRGQRVELGEINSIILDSSEVKDCVTLLYQLGESVQRLVTFWVPNTTNPADFVHLKPAEYLLTLSDLFESLVLSLPSYMVPTHLVPISRIPSTAQSKVDKRVLFSTYKTLSNAYLDSISSNTSTTDDTGTFSEIERTIATALASTTRVPISQMSRNSSFFSLGLDSISSVQFSRQLKNSGVADLPVSVILKNPSVARLSAYCTDGSAKNFSLQQRHTAVADALSVSIRSQIRSEFEKRNLLVKKILPCTPLQEAMLSNTSTGATTSYCNTTIFEVHGNLSQLQHCWSQMFERHEILRTAFIPTDDPNYPFVQVVLEQGAVRYDSINPHQDVEKFASESITSLLSSFSPPVRLAVRRSSETVDLIFCCHHALYDGTAVQVLLREIEQAYVGEALPPIVPYERYLQHAISQDLRAADDFWTSSLYGFEPTYFPILSSRTDKPESIPSSITEQLQIPLSNVSKACQLASVSLLSVIQGAWAKLLHLYFGEDDLCFGNVVSGRTLPEQDLDRLVAPCFNTLPVRLRLNVASSNADLVRQLHNFNINSLPFQLTPLRRIQARVLREGGHLFDTLVILQQPTTPLDSSVWTLKEERGTMDLPVVCEVFQDATEDSLTLKLHYNGSVMSEDDAKLVARTFDYSLQSLSRSPHSPAGDTGGFPAGILSDSNINFKTLNTTENALLHFAFEENARCRPGLIALEFQETSGGRKTLSFRELNEKANQIAHALIERGIRLEDVVPIHIPKSPEFYASILGVLKAGGAFTPIHPDLPNARKKFMLTELRPKVLLCADTTTFNWCGDTPVLNVDVAKDFPNSNPSVPELSPTNLAYCLYTSGSTGTPKAVSMDHRSPIQTIEASKELVPWDHNSRLLQYAAISFDMCYYDCWLAWTFGFTLCAAEQHTMLNDITGVINSMKVDLLDLTPSVAASFKRVDVPTVRWLYCIGEAMTPEIITAWEGACVNSYGPTEAAFCTTIFSAKKSIKSNIIGKPFPTTSFAVFARSGDRILPVFSLGELYIGGAQLARGYYGQPDLTEQRFVQKDGQRFYKSGDKVRMLGDGNFEFVGRLDDQVKIRGLRVELGEINHVIQACDNSITAITTQILRKSSAAKDQLVSFLVTNVRNGEATQPQLREKVKQAAKRDLPSYMVPRFFVFVDKIPKSAAGKINKKALTDIFRAQENKESEEELDRDHTWTEIDSQIREVFAKLSCTPIEEILPTTSIYQLGLDSISAVQVASALRKRGYEVTAADVLKFANCIDLAAQMNEASSQPPPVIDAFDFASFDNQFRGQVLESPDIKSLDLETIRPCTPLQKGMLSQFIAKEGTIYFNHLRLRLDSEIDLNKLKGAWETAMKHHRMLRTGFVPLKDKNHAFAMIHYVANTLNVPWDDVSEREQSESMQEWLLRSGREAVSRLQHPPWQIRVVKTETETCLDLAMFHALFDAQSLRTIFHDVSAAYNGATLAKAAPLEAVLSTVLSHRSNDDRERTAFWEGVGRKIVPTRFPNLAPLRYDPKKPAVVSKYSQKSLTDLEAGCRKANITLQAAGLASWASLLVAYTGESSVTFGLVLSGRNFEAAESAVFPCISTVPFVCTVDDDRKKMVMEIMSFNAEVQRHQFTPLNEIQKLSGYPNEVLFDTIFAFQKMPNDDGQQHPWTVVDENATIEYPISIELEPKDGRLEFRLTFLPHLIPREQAKLILEQLDHLMNMTIFPNARTENTTSDPTLYSITPPKEPSLSADVTLLHEFVEQTALEHPKRVAFEFATSISDGQYTSNSWTYENLNAEGNRIANLLISHGVQPGGLVGVCFDKCPEASFAMLGILKAGCAFVALDPGAPTARRAFIVEDSGAEIVLSKKAQSSDLYGSLRATVLNLDSLDLSTQSKLPPKLQRSLNPQDRSYCLYTSGTTGTPKGCELTHENAVQALMAFRRLFAGHWDDNSRWLQFASFHFDVSVLEQYWSWSVGIRVVSASRDLIFEDLAAAISTLGITHIDLTPSLAQILHPDDVPSLCKGVFITGGESLKQEILDVWGPTGVIYNGYGPTEATIGVTMYPRVPANGKPSNIGPQFENVGSYVLKPGSDVPVLRGGIGELCVSGKLVGKGYLNHPAMTADRFPCLSRFNEKVYRTGDLVRILHDNTFDFLGRADDQVKLRGQRLEIGEINSVIKHSGTAILDVATLVLKHPKQQKEQLVSFIVSDSVANGKPEIILEKTSQLEQAREACQYRLPPYMVPTHFVALSALPLSANNKADGRRLKSMYEALSASDLLLLSGTGVAKNDDWSKDEQKIRDVLEGFLDTDAKYISKTSSFFELGLDSISAITFSRALKQAGFSSATPSLIIKNTSISRLIKALSKGPHFNDRGSVIAAKQSIIAIQHRHRRPVAEALHIDPRDIEALAPCTPLQLGMIARFLESDHGLYFNSFHMKLAESVDTRKLKDTWTTAFASMPTLRTVFANTEDGFVQAVCRAPSFPWKFCNLSNDALLNATLEKLRRDWWQANRVVLKRPFELHLIATPKRKVLAVHIFHALYDGISIGLLFQALWENYNGRPTQDVGPSFHSSLAHGMLRPVHGAQNFWIKHLSNHTFHPLPYCKEVSHEGTVTATRQLVDLSAYETIRRKLDVTPQAIAQACWSTVLANYVKGSPTLGIIASGRSIDFEGADRIIGPMFNTLPYQHHFQSRESWTSIVKRTHEFNVAAHPYQHTPLRDIIKWTKRNPGQPLFDTLFVYQVAPDNDEWAKNNIWKLEDGGAKADYPLAFEVEQSVNDSLILTLVAQAHVLKENDAQQLLDGFEESLRTVLHTPDTIVEARFSEEKENEERQPTMDKARVLRHANGFKWSPPALQIKEEIMSLASADGNDVNEYTSIFELGLDSIDAIKLSSKLKRQGINLLVSDIMRSLTIQNMITSVSGNDRKKQQHPSHLVFNSHKRALENYTRSTGMETDNVESILPLTPLQEAMVAEMISSNYTRYYNHDVLKLAPDVDLPRFRAAWTKVVKASPILRTSFIQIDDPNIDFAYAQVVHRTPHDFECYNEYEDDPNFLDVFEHIRKEAANANSSPLFHVRLLETRREKFVVLSIAHALYDGWSLGLLHSDIHKEYTGNHTQRPGYEFALREILTASGRDAAAFWRDYLSDAQPTFFKRCLEGGPDQTVHRAERSSRTSLDNIISFVKKKNITLQTLGQTVYALVLAAQAQSLDVTFGSVLSGRDDDYSSEIMFPTMNTVAVRAILHGSRRELLQYMQENSVNIKQWQHFPLRKLQSLAGKQGKLFDSLFIYQKSTKADDINTPKLYESIQSHSDVEYPVCIEMESVRDKLLWRCAIRGSVCDKTGARHFLDTLDSVMKDIIEQPDAATIDFTSDGTSICGLPAFKNEQSTSLNDKSLETAAPAQEVVVSPTATAIREVIALVSKTPEKEISNDMTIFHIGLDSISAIKVTSLLRKRSIVLSVGDMLKAGTIENMARTADEHIPTTGDDGNDMNGSINDTLKDVNQDALLLSDSIKMEDVEQILPATAGQYYMMSMWLNSKGTLFYPEFSYQLDGQLPFRKLQESWQSLIVATPILRTILLATHINHVPYIQAVLRMTNASITDITGMSGEEASTEIRNCESKQPYVHLFVSKTLKGWHLRLKISHTLYDGVSLPILVRRYQDLCNNIDVSSIPSENIGKSITSGASHTSFTIRKSFWTKYLRGVAQNNLTQPNSPPTSKTENYHPALLEDTRGLDRLARKHGISMQSIFVATYAKLYAALTRERKDKDVVIGIYLANRSHLTQNMSEAAIPTVNLVPIRVRAPQDTNVLEVAAQVQHDVLEISTPVNSSVSLYEIFEWTGVQVDTFVNFLKLPDIGILNNMPLEAETTITQTGQWDESISRVAKTPHTFSEAPKELVQPKVTSAYRVSCLLAFQI